MSTATKKRPAQGAFKMEILDDSCEACGEPAGYESNLCWQCALRFNERPIHNRRTRDFRRHQSDRHMWRRLKEDRNEHYNDLGCPCWTDRKAMARFKEQPQFCSRECCGNQRPFYGPSHSERKRRARGH